MKYINQSHKYYFEHPEIWEEINQSRFENEPKFIVQIFKKYGKVKNVLDVGSGTGTHLARLSEYGLKGAGVDANAKMVAFAKQKYPDLQFKVPDMRKLSYKNNFDAVLSLCTTFSYNVTNEEAVLALKNFHKALRRNGILIIDLLNAIGFIQRKKFKNKIKADYPKFGLKSVTEHKIDENKQAIVETRTILNAKSRGVVKNDITTLRIFFPQEFRYLLETNGFKFINFYGSYDIKDSQLGHSRMIAVAKKL